MSLFFYFLFLETVRAPLIRSARPATQTPAVAPVLGLAAPALFAVFDELSAAFDVSALLTDSEADEVAEDVSSELQKILCFRKIRQMSLQSFLLLMKSLVS